MWALGIGANRRVAGISRGRLPELADLPVAEAHRL
jgi:hypothetical protein